MSKITVLVVDDQPILREGVRALLTMHDDIDVVGEAGTGMEALEKVAELSPNVVVMDIAMPQMDGLEATRRIHKKYPNTKVLILTQRDNREYTLSSIKAGAVGCIPKNALPSDLVLAIRTVSKGESFLYPSMAKMLVENYQEGGAEVQRDCEGLTDREREVLELIAEDYTNAEIANKLFISIKTVLNYRASIMEKLDVHSPTGLVKYAIRKGLIKMDS